MFLGVDEVNSGGVDVDWYHNVPAGDAAEKNRASESL